MRDMWISMKSCMTKLFSLNKNINNCYILHMSNNTNYVKLGVRFNTHNLYDRKYKTNAESVKLSLILSQQRIKH